MKTRGFTLSELLIALVILGAIATFTIPKVLQTHANSRRKAVFRETIATLNQLTRKAADQGGLANITEMRQFFRDNLNYVKICKTDPNAEGCWNGDGFGAVGNQDAYLLSNGAMITSFNGIAVNGETLGIDWNGLEGPNANGDDILGLRICWGPASCTSGAVAIYGSRPNGPGTVGPGNASDEALFEEIFSD